MENKITINGSNLLNNVAQDWGGVNNTQSEQTIYGTTVPPGYEWSINHGEVERFIKSKFTEASSDVGYYVCSTAAATAAKTVSASGYVLSAGGNIRIKMTNANTASNATLNINSTGAKALFYNGSQASPNNSWIAGEVVVVYYDGTRYQATNSLGGAGSSVVADEEDLTIARVNNTSVMKLKDKEYQPAQYSGLGRVYLRKNMQTVDVVTEIQRTAITIPNSYAYLIDLENHTCDYTNSSNRFSSRSICWDADVNEGDTFEILGSSMTSAYSPVTYHRWRLWVMVDKTTKEILQDGQGNYLMAEESVNHEGDGVIITIPRDCHLIVNFWTGQTSGGVHLLNLITTTTEQRNVNLFDNTLCTQQNTQYIIEYDYDLNGQQVSLPKGSALKFEGGSIRNSSAYSSSIVGDDAAIDAGLQQIFSTSVVLSGTWRNETYYPEWFGAKGDNLTDDTRPIQAALNLGNSISVPLNITVKLNKTYLFSDTLVMYANTTLFGNAIMTSGNNFKGYTLHAVFSDPHKCAIMSANMVGLRYKDGAARTSIDGGSIKYCDGIRIQSIVMQGDKVLYERDGETLQMPIFCGIKIVASSLSSIKDSCIRGFWYGIARFATWYSSDEDIFISSYKCGYYAGYDMNNFSIRNGYINSNDTTGITLTNDDKFNTDPSLTSTYGVLANYACGGLYNVISECANYGRYYALNSQIVDIHSWMESIKTSCYGVFGGARLTIIEGFFMGNTFLTSNDSTYVKLIGRMPSGEVKVGKYDVFEVSYAGSKNLKYTGMESNCGTDIYDREDTGLRLYWSPDNFYGYADGFNVQRSFSGSIDSLPTDFNLRQGSVFMKTETDGTVRPLFQKTAGTRCSFSINVSTLPVSDGYIHLRFFTQTISVRVTSESTKNDILSYIRRVLVTNGTDVDGHRIHGFFARFLSGSLQVLYNTAGIYSINDFGFEDTDETGTVITFTNFNSGSYPVFVDASGKSAETDQSCIVLPDDAPNGSSVLWNNKMVYRNSGHWFDYSGKKITYDFRLTSGMVENTVSTSGASVSFGILSKYDGMDDNVIVVDDYDTESTLVDNGSGQFSLTVSVAANRLTSERTQTVTITQLSTNVEIHIKFTQSAAEEPSNIVISDAAFKAKLVELYDINEDQEISYDEAALPTRLVGNNLFSNNGIEDIDAFNFFINITQLNNSAFNNNPIDHFVGKNITILDRNVAFSSTSIKYAYFPKAKYLSFGSSTSVWYGVFAGCSSLIGVRYDKTTILPEEFYGSGIQFLILLAPSVVRVNSTTSFPNKIYVRDSLVESYKESAIWEDIANRICPVSQFTTDFPSTPSYMTKGLDSYYLPSPNVINTSGLFANRPTAGISAGFVYFATDLGTDGMPIWYTGSTWVDATGEEISVL